MTSFGYTMMTEQSRPDRLVSDVVAAEAAGFDFSVCSDHFQPWLAEQGHAGYAWSILGAAAQATERIGLMTYVTCPTIRYHPAIVAQKAATLGILSGNRFRLGLGSGENLNEHVVGERWPAVGVRHEMLYRGGADHRRGCSTESESVNFRGDHFDVEQAKLWDLPDQRVPIGIAVSGEQSCTLAGKHADLMIAVEPKAELGEMFDAAGGEGKPRVGQIALVLRPRPRDRRAAGPRAVSLVRARAGRSTPTCPTRSRSMPRPRSSRPSRSASSSAAAPIVEEHVEKIRPFVDAGFTEVALVQIGGEQQAPFIRWAQDELLPALRSL